MPVETIVSATDAQTLASRAGSGSLSGLRKLLKALARGEPYQTSAGNPNGSNLSIAIGEWCFDTTNGIFYKAAVANSLVKWQRLTETEDATAGSVIMFDDFLAKAIDTNKWDLQKGSDGATVNFAANAQLNGVVRATTGAGAGASMAVNGVQIDSALNYQANKGALVFETKLKLSAITTIAVFVGLTNQVAALQAPIIGAGGGDTFTANAADACGFIFDTTMTTAKWWAQGVKATVQGTAVNSTAAPVAATFDVIRLEVSATGTLTAYLNGTALATIANAVTITVPLSPVITAFTRAAGSATVDVDYIRVSQAR